MKTHVTVIALICSVVISLSAFGQAAKSDVKISCPLLPSHPVKIVRPIYPELAKQAHIEGRVSLSCLVRTDGTIDKIEVKSGHPLLIQAACDAVSKWKFKPMKLNGKAVEMETVVNIDFQLPKNQKDSASKSPT
jgi:TonB family protein